MSSCVEKNQNSDGWQGTMHHVQNDDITDDTIDAP